MLQDEHHIRHRLLLPGGPHPLLEGERLAVLDRAEVTDPEFVHGYNVTPVSRRCFTVARNCADRAPSSARWSQLRPRIVIGLMAMESLPSASVTTTGRFTIASRSRIPTWGWLMMGVAMIAPYCPGVVIVHVPPWTSSRGRCRDRARRATSRIRAASPSTENSWARWMTG